MSHSVARCVIAVVTLLPGLDGLRAALARQPSVARAWRGPEGALRLGVYVAIFRMVSAGRMSWRVSYQIGVSEMGANALLPTGGAGGLALGA
jgi:hypothetical protein